MTDTFKPFDKVLVRDAVEMNWELALYAYKDNGHYHHDVGGGAWTNCISYEGNEHLLGTTDTPEKRFRFGEIVEVYSNELKDWVQAIYVGPASKSGLHVVLRSDTREKVFTTQIQSLEHSNA